MPKPNAIEQINVKLDVWTGDYFITEKLTHSWMAAIFNYSKIYGKINLLHQLILITKLKPTTQHKLSTDYTSVSMRTEPS